MKLAVITPAIALLLTTAIWAQNTAPTTSAAALAQSAAPAARQFSRMRGRGMVTNPQVAPGADASFDGRLREMQDTLNQMHALLRDMETKASTAKTTPVKTAATKSSETMDNIRMWQLLLNHLDMTLAQARMTAMRRVMSQRSMPGGQIPVAAPNPAAAVSGNSSQAPASTQK